METHSKYYWLIVGVAALVVLGMVFVLGDYLAKDATISSQEIGSKKTEGKARLVVEFGDGKKRAFNGEVVAGMTVYDALDAARKAAQKTAGFSFSLKDDTISEIDGVKNNSHEWRYYVNGKSVDMSPRFEEVGPGDEIVFRFE